MSRKSPAISIARVYNADGPTRGYRVLVDRVWPRGMKKSDLELDAWFKEVAPSTELRKWFAHDPSRWGEFCRRYTTELQQGSEQLAELLAIAGEKSVVLLYGARDEQHNQAVVLRDFLIQRLKQGRAQ